MNPGLKQLVKMGELTPQEALKRLVDRCRENGDDPRATKTYWWLVRRQRVSP